MLAGQNYETLYYLCAVFGMIITIQHPIFLNNIQKCEWTLLLGHNSMIGKWDIIKNGMQIGTLHW